MAHQLCSKAFASQEEVVASSGIAQCRLYPSIIDSEFEAHKTCRCFKFWMSYRYHVIEQTRKLCQGGLQLTLLNHFRTRLMVWICMNGIEWYFMGQSRDKRWFSDNIRSCISPSSNGEICPGWRTGVVNDVVLGKTSISASQMQKRWLLVCAACAAASACYFLTFWTKALACWLARSKRILKFFVKASQHMVCTLVATNRCDHWIISFIVWGHWGRNANVAAARFCAAFSCRKSQKNNWQTLHLDLAEWSSKTD